MMRMSNSALVSHVNISPNKNSPRNHAIDTITIHCVVGQCSAETLGNIFKPASRQASSNYGVGTDGRIGMYVEERDRSWCSSSAANDNRAVTIEVASDTSAPYAVNAKAYAALIDLVTDICKRNGIGKLLWKGDKGLVGQADKQNMTVHRWFANKSCPGDWLYERHGAIADEVNRRLGSASAPTPAPAPSGNKSTDELAREVIAGAWGNGEDRRARLAAAGHEYAAVQERVNAILGGGASVSAPAPSGQKSIDELAREVIRGDWGNGSERKSRLAAAGYAYASVQKRVNAILGGGTSVPAPSAAKSTDELAREVIRGEWGNGEDRRRKLAAAGYDYATVQKRVNAILG
jgi:hypothetical protein